MVAEFLGRILDLEQDAPRTLEERGASFREDGLAPKTMKKLVANLSFQVQNLLT